MTSQLLDEKVIINVAGTKFKARISTLERFPDSLLGNEIKRRMYFDKQRNEFFFDRSRLCFDSILYYYQTNGLLKAPVDVPLDVFKDEVEFFELGEQAMEQLGEKNKFTWNDEENLSDTKANKIWIFCESPESSAFARIFAFISITVIIISICSLCIETLPYFTRYTLTAPKKKNRHIFTVKEASYSVYERLFFWIETFCTIWFTVEFFTRLLTAPNLLQFLRSTMNVFDVFVIVPYYISLLRFLIKGTSKRAKFSMAMLRIIRLVRIFRLFKLSKYSLGLKILGRTLHSSFKEFTMVIYIMCFCVLVFSSAIYYAEFMNKNSMFTSIPHSFWWAIMTMTTVGYGDVCPCSNFGRVIAALCAVTGVLTITLPLPIIVSNYNDLYMRETEYEQRKSEKRR